MLKIAVGIPGDTKLVGERSHCDAERHLSGFVSDSSNMVRRTGTQRRRVRIRCEENATLLKLRGNELPYLVLVGRDWMNVTLGIRLSYHVFESFEDNTAREQQPTPALP